ncbi:MAG: E3 binding domain-containing protein, partial [Gammaproteobacteria bacterium]|nr:E3 binding domain-containing protein [Gammaproteobacteria bacterium]
MAKQSVLAPDMGVDGPVEVIEINVAVGDGIHVDDVIAIMESDKATLEVPASHSGTVDSLAIKVGDKVSQGDLLLIVSEENSVGSAGGIEASDPPSTLQEETAFKHVTPKHKDSPQENTAQGQTKGVSVEMILVPDIGADNAEVIEVAQEGQPLNKDDAIVVLESDKASMEVPAPHTGTIRKLWVKVGDKLKQGDPLAEMDVEDAGTETPVPNTSQPSTEGKAQPNTLIPNASKGNAEPNSQSGGVHAGPAVRRIAREFGITLAEISGSGPKGRILKEDLMAYTTQKLAQASQNTGGAFVEPLPEIDFSRYGETELIPRTKIQKVSAKNLLRSWHTVPQVTQFEEADITDLESFRKAQK